MSNLTETSNWDAGVYQFAITDPIEGGPGGIDNQPHQSLTDRTLWLRNRIAAAIIQSGQADGTSDNQQLAEAVVLQVASVAALRAVPVPVVPSGQTVLVLTRGQAADGDGLSATYKWSSASTAVDDGVTIVTPSSAPTSGRWLVCGINATALGGQAASFYATAATVAAAVAPLAPLMSPEFTGTPTAPTPAPTDSSNKLATTAWIGTEFLSHAGIALVWNGTGGTYYKLATLPASSTSTADSITVKATLNVGSVAANDTMLEAIFGNRGAFNYVYNLFGPNTAGTAIVCYAETDGTTSVYALCTASQGFATVTIVNAGIPGTSASSTLYPTPPSTTTPTGTLIFNSGAPGTYPTFLALQLAASSAATLASAETYAAAQAAAATTAAEAFTTTALASYALLTALALKANLAGPTFTGAPAAPTAAPGTSTTQLATTAFVAAATNATQNLAANGYKKHPNGFMEAWGLMTIAASGGTAVDFLTACGAAFPAACFGVQLTALSSSDSGAGLGVPFAYSVSAAGFSADNTAGDAINTYWHAYGH
jgi:hypothetical protein